MQYTGIDLDSRNELALQKGIMMKGVGLFLCFNADLGFAADGNAAPNAVTTFALRHVDTRRFYMHTCAIPS